jgi:hypothetical protein
MLKSPLCHPGSLGKPWELVGIGAIREVRISANP